MAVPGHYSDGVRRALEGLIRDFSASGGLQALVVYGSLARGTFREGVSDLNLAVVLEQATSEALARLRDPLQSVQRALRLEPFFVTAVELEHLTDVFPIKLLDIQRYHDLIHGVDVFAPLKFRWQDVRLRAEQEFRNHQLRLRRAWTLGGASAASLTPALKRSASSLITAVETLFWLRGTSLPATEPQAVFEQAARAFDLDAGVLIEVARFKGGAPGVDVAALFQGLMVATDRLAEIVDGLEPPT